jgi:hypothetical protein
MLPLLDGILTVNLIFSTLIFYIGARIYLLPKIKELKPQVILLPILLLHSFRHLGLMFLARGAVYPGMPAQFAFPAAIGDFVAAVLAFAAIPAVANCDHPGHGLRSAALYGRGLLDTGVLGPGAPRDALHCVRRVDV